MVADPNMAEVNNIVISLVIRYRMILMNANKAAKYTIVRLSKSPPDLLWRDSAFFVCFSFASLILGASIVWYLLFGYIRHMILDLL